MPDLRTERREGILVITIDRPDVRNAINLEVAEGIAKAMDLLDSDDALTVGVLTGAGGYFSAGMDLAAFSSGQRPYAGGRGFGGLVEKPPLKPLIAAVEGFAFAGGMELALACDLIVAAEGAKFALPEAKRGLVASAGGLLRLQESLTRQVAMQMVLTGEPITSARAHELGMVSAVSDAGGALQVSLDIAERMAGNAPLSLRAGKKVLLESPSWTPSEKWVKQREITEPVTGSEDAREGARAFVERRSPQWRGR